MATGTHDRDGDVATGGLDVEAVKNDTLVRKGNLLEVLVMRNDPRKVFRE